MNDRHQDESIPGDDRDEVPTVNESFRVIDEQIAN